MTTDTADIKLIPKDFTTDQEVRWCPGCGDYSILKQVQSILPETGVNKEDIVFISGIGCSSRFPYYMDTFGMHSIHGRATAVASGLKIARPELSVWVITGDGDSLSIGGNHLIHTIRRNFNMNILLFNNEIYGLTKGQYSPTSPEGKVTKSTPMGSLDHPFNPMALCLGADATFIARAMDRDVKHLREVLVRANDHVGTSLLEIYQNCNVFNDGAFEIYTDKGSKKEEALFLEEGQPLVFGSDDNRGIILDNGTPKVVKLDDGTYTKEDLWIHDSSDKHKAYLLTTFFDNPSLEGHMPRPFGVFYAQDRFRYEEAMYQQLDLAVERKGEGNLDKLLRGENTWTVS
ncbi:2-oxoacid:ferredoxin oxidoreductase subunit beta [bacterium]|nr:2-oxoacid:ferredoxin oxidoreductase subunit beta [bacterium]